MLVDHGLTNERFTDFCAQTGLSSVHGFTQETKPVFREFASNHL
jgi:hypothetical protein